MVDFYCPEAQLIIEVHGEYHQETGQQFVDFHRDSILQNHGFHILRFTIVV
ncbi:MAG: DUF559 domain-containing protein [Bacteroidota bacterium]